MILTALLPFAAALVLACAPASRAACIWQSQSAPVRSGWLDVADEAAEIARIKTRYEARLQRIFL